MKEGKKVKRCGWDSSDSYSIGKNRWGREYIHITGKPHVTIVDMLCGNILANDWEEVGGGVRMNEEEKCCGNCLWFIDEDCLGDGWCNENDCETSCDKVCKKHEF